MSSDPMPWLVTDTSDGEETRFASRELAEQHQSVPWETLEYRPEHITVPDGWEWSMEPTTSFRFRLDNEQPFWEVTRAGDEWVLRTPYGMGGDSWKHEAVIVTTASPLVIAWRDTAGREWWMDVDFEVQLEVRLLASIAFTELSSAAGRQEQWS